MRIYKIHTANMHDPEDTSCMDYSFNVSADNLTDAVTKAELQVAYPMYIDEINCLAGDDIRS